MPRHARVLMVAQQFAQLLEVLLSAPKLFQGHPVHGPILFRRERVIVVADFRQGAQRFKDEDLRLLQPFAGSPMR